EENDVTFASFFAGSGADLIEGDVVVPAGHANDGWITIYEIGLRNISRRVPVDSTGHFYIQRLSTSSSYYYYFHSFDGSASEWYPNTPTADDATNLKFGSGHRTFPAVELAKEAVISGVFDPAEVLPTEQVCV